MIEKNISKNDYLIFAVFSSIWVFLGLIACLSAIGGFFYSWIFGGFLLLMIFTIIRQVFLKKISLNISHEFIIASIAIFIFVLVSSYFVTPTIFGGRDQGAISEATIRLSQNHKLEFSTPASNEFFEIYGPGKALNFPGFYYNSSGELITQFPIAYISWLAIFYSFFGLTGLIVANAVLLFLFLASFYLLARSLVETKYSAIILILTATSFPIFWFFKFTLSENMALALLWLSILWLFLFIREQRLFYYFSFLFSAGLLVFTRIEGIFFLIAGFLTIFFFTGKNIIWKRKRKLILAYPAIFFAILLVLNFAKDIYFYKEMAKAFLHIRQDQASASSVFDGFFSPAIFEFQVLYLYGIISSLLLGILGTIYFWIKKQWKNLIPFFVIFPSFIYLINPWISSDHPWMLRRFVFSVVPGMIFYAILFLAKWNGEKKMRYKIMASYFVIISILLLNLFIFANYFPFSENKNLLKQTQAISENFGGNDLILIDKSASGDGFSMLGGPMNFLYEKNSVYFFNIKDLEKIDQEKFSKIYLVTSDQNAIMYEDIIGTGKILSSKDYSVETQRLSGSRDKENIVLQEKLSVKVSGKILELRITN
ncbi:MAG: glycosyltransferase family 39 protein [Parcubacteria group bacterium]